MSHHLTLSGRPMIRCDEPVPNEATLFLSMRRCGRPSFGDRLFTRWAREDAERSGAPFTQIGLGQLARGWSVAPYPDDFDHGAPRRMIDGTTSPGIEVLAGVFGDLHTCPPCRRRLDAARARRGAELVGADQ